MYALVDTGSDATFIDDNTVELLNLTSSEQTGLKIRTICDGLKAEKATKVHRGLRLRSFYGNSYTEIPPAYSISEIPMNRDTIPNKNSINGWKHLEKLRPKIPPLQDCNIGILIGHDCTNAFIPRDLVVGRDGEPFALKTDLGWSIIGPAISKSTCNVDQRHVTCNRILVKESPVLKPSDACRILENDFESTKEGMKTSQDDIKFLQILENNVRRDHKNRLEMPLPFRQTPDLPNNRQLALKRLESLKRKLSSNDELHKEYVKFMNTILERNDAEETVGGEDQEWYLPHHGVFHPKKKKLRVVFDCSASYKGTNLNEHLLTGPNLINELTGVFMRFRAGEIAFTCDIEKMFHQFRVEEKDRRFLKFLWWKDGDLSREPSTYRMNVHLFGAASSPGCANFGLKYLAREKQDSDPEAAAFIRDNFYVDDGIGSLDAEEEACSLIKSATEICKEGGLRLHKFTSNSNKVLESVPVSERADTDNTGNPNLSKPIENERTLGMEWNVNKDTLHFSNVEITSPATRRGILSTVASLYDPLGLISPFVLKGKAILQEVCHKGSRWDEKVEGPTLSRWEEWKQQLSQLNKVSINRCYRPSDFGESIKTELHHFSDASTTGYGMCTYLRLTNSSGRVHCALVAAKARVAPMKVVSIPRLELTAAVVAAQIGATVKNQLKIEIHEEYFWTDSTVVLGYINNDAKRFHVFVSNRVQKIKNLTAPEQWRHVSTEDNPADHASRGLSLTQLKDSNWFTGPQWLWNSELSVTPHEIPSLQPQDPEVKICLQLSSKAPETLDWNERLKHMSSWTKAKAVVARLKKIANGGRDSGPIGPEEVRKAENQILRNIQQHAFPELYDKTKRKSLSKKHPLYKAEPFLHEGLVRAGGRNQGKEIPIEQRNPIILPKCHVANLIIQHCHEKIKHQGIGFTLNEIRSHGFWILGAYQTVSKIIRNCSICARLRGRPCEQRMADLPPERIEASPPFTHVGIDCFGA